VTDKSTRIGICAGEMSGDLLAGAVMEAWVSRHSSLDLTGIGGSRLQAAGLQSLCAMDRLSVMGLVEPLKRLPELLSIRRQLITQQLGEGPDLFLGVDSPDFNLPVERRLRAAGIATAHLVSPSVWAWRKGRIDVIRQATKKMLCLLPFEVDIYRAAGVDAVCVGHPLVDELSLLPDSSIIRRGFELSDNQSILGVLPGSREAEVRQHMPIFAGAMAELRQRHSDLHFVIPAANAERRAQIQQILHRFDLPVTVVEGQGREVMQASDALMIASGTATLEAMLLGKPMVIGYRMASLSWFILSRLVTSSFVGLPNILAGGAVAPELLQRELTPARLANVVSGLLDGLGEKQVVRFRELAGQIGGNFADRCVDALLPLTHSS
jgi:lipid-A-disaccharide synthase